MTVPIVVHHIHFYVPKGAGGGREGVNGGCSVGRPARGGTRATDLPGINPEFLRCSEQPVFAGKGRMLDHIGFEVKNLEAFCRKLQMSGVTLDAPYTRQADGIGRDSPAVGASISELTEACGKRER